jgi:hypothetical protein
MEAGKPAENTAEAVERAIKLLETTQTEFFKQTGCVACHHGVTTAMATKIARSHGHLQRSQSGRGVPQDRDHHQTQVWRRCSRSKSILRARLTQRFTRCSAWIRPTSNPTPLRTRSPCTCSATIVPTSLVVGGIARAPTARWQLASAPLRRVKVLNRYLPPAMSDEYKSAMEEIKARVRREPVNTTDDAAMKLLALTYIGAPEAELRIAAKALESRQRADGGWGGKSEMASDAYSTGLSIYALSESGRAGERRNPTAAAPRGCCAISSRRLMACSQPRAEVPTLLRERFPIRR